ncbi:hypothetical protein ACIQUC_15740 [Curtobacterium sp. NPDC098951]|uniref:hypothetical protein n=1 Tax=Curtobacterium sp. NPDC098951 TaxID=3363974 RepID=UPI00380B449B
MHTLLHVPRSRRRSIAAATLGALALIGSLLVATPAHALNDTGTGGVFVPTTGRIMDTKNNIGGYSTPMPAKTWRTVQVTGLAGVPDDGTVGAVSVVATVADISATGQLFGRPDADTKYTLMGIYGGEQQQNTSFSSVLAVGADGTIQVYAETSARLILDVQGYYTANTDGTAPGGFVPLNGKRVADTRSGTGLPQAQLTTGKSAVLQVTGTAGVPAGASAVIVNLVAMNATSNVGFLTPYPTGAARPANSFNYAGGTTTTMQAQVQLSADGKITIYNANSTMDLAIDIQGYFTATGSSGAMFTPGSGRIFDTRAAGSTILAGNETRAIAVAGQQGVPVMGSGINSVVLTLTAKAANGSGWGRVWANGTSEPDTASLRYDNGTIRSNTITVPVGANGKVSLHNLGTGATDFIIDVQGWYTNPVAPVVTCPYAEGSTTPALPSAAFDCNVVLPPASGLADSAEIFADGVSQWSGQLSDADFQTIAAHLSTQGGPRSVTATTRTADGSPVSTDEFDFTVGGNWDQESLTEFPGNGANASITTNLGGRIVNDEWPQGTQFKYTLSTNADPAVDSLVATDWLPGDYTVPTGILTAGTTYFWRVSVTGTPSGSSSITTRDLPVQAFTASNDAIAPECTAPFMAQAAAEDYQIQASDWVKYCPGTAEQENSDDPVTESASSGTVSAPGSVGTSDSTTASTTIHSQTWNQTSAFNPVWAITHSGKVFYDGKRAWVKKYRGKTGYHTCDTDGYANVVEVNLLACGTVEKSNGSVVMYMTHNVITPGPWGTHFTSTYTVHRTYNKGGVSFAGSGTGL